MDLSHPFEERISPEAAGLSSRAIEAFLDSAEDFNLHGFLLLRRDRVAAEGYWPPFGPDRLHRLYSVSKSFTSAAIGMLAGEGKLKLDDKICDYFPDQLPKNPHPYLLQTTVRDLLTMATPHRRQAYDGPWQESWIHEFFHFPPDHVPGTIYNYDTAATLLLCHLIRRLTGQDLTEYLRPRLFDPIGASAGICCVRAPEGVEWGGSGILASLRDMAKVGYVFMNGGKWEGRQLIPEWYCQQATHKQIDNSFEGGTGYGYQIREIPGGFSFNGMGGQFMFAFPEKELVFACFADCQYDPSGTAYRDLRRAVIALCQGAGEPLPEDGEAQTRLARRLSSLVPKPLGGDVDSPLREEIDGREYEIDEGNPMGWKTVRFEFFGREGAIHYVTNRGRHDLAFGFGFRKEGVFPETGYAGMRINVPKGEGYACQASAAWTQADKLKVRVHVTDDYLGGMEMEFAFKGNQLSVHMAKTAEWFLEEYQGFAGGRVKEIRA